MSFARATTDETAVYTVKKELAANMMLFYEWEMGEEINSVIRSYYRDARARW